MHKNKQIKSEYINNVENIINTCGFSGIWESQSLSNSKWFKLVISQKLHDHYLQEWSSVVDISSYGSNYRLYKETFGFSSYFSILPSYYSKSLVSFRTGNHKLLIEIGRWNDVPFYERVCHLCQKDLKMNFSILYHVHIFKGKVSMI